MAAVLEADLGLSGEKSLLGSLEVRQRLESSLKLLVCSGIRLHLLTMGTPQTSKALLGAAGYDLSLFYSFLGPFDMACISHFETFLIMATWTGKKQLKASSSTSRKILTLCTTCNEQLAIKLLRNILLLMRTVITIIIIITIIMTMWTYK